MLGGKPAFLFMFPVANHPSNGADWQLQGTVGLETELRQVFSQAFLCQATTTHIRSEAAVLMLPEYNFIFLRQDAIMIT